MTVISHIARFLLICLCVTFLAVLAIFGYIGWKVWWPEFMAQPTVEWTDTTVDLTIVP